MKGSLRGKDNIGLKANTLEPEMGAHVVRRKKRIWKRSEKGRKSMDYRKEGC